MASRKICVCFIHGGNNETPKGEKGGTPKGRGKVKLLTEIRNSSKLGMDERLSEKEFYGFEP